MSGVKTWNPFYSDYRRAELCICEQIVIFFFLKKKKEKKRKKKKVLKTDMHTHTRTRSHAHRHRHKTFVLFLKTQSQSGFRIKRGWAGPGGHAHCWAQNLLGRHLMVFTMPTATSKRHCQNSGNTCGQLGGRTCLDMHTHTKKGINKRVY